jgi:hypothetical protein
MNEDDKQINKQQTRLRRKTKKLLIYFKTWKKWVCMIQMDCKF